VNVFNEYKAWLEIGDYCEPSYDTYREMERYQYTEDGGAEHVNRKGSLDPAEGRENHGDSVIATTLMIWKAKELRKKSGERKIEGKPEKLTMAWAHDKVKREM